MTVNCHKLTPTSTVIQIIALITSGLKLASTQNETSTVETITVTAKPTKHYGQIWNGTCPLDCACEMRLSEYVKANGRMAFLKTVDCSFKRLKYVPSDVPLDTQALILKGNSISDLLDQIPDLIDLQVLDVSGNKIRSVGRGHIFYNLANLTYFNMAKNELQTLFREVFKGLIRLQQLVLADNKLNSIEDQTFYGLSSLQKLDISQNQLGSIYTEWFMGLGNLIELKLVANRARHITSATFRPLKRLLTLDLSQNRIAAIQDDAFYGLELLENLYLDSNKLHSVPIHSFQMVKNLKILTLNNNPILKIANSEFSDLSVHTIELTNMSQLNLIDAKAFRNLTSLLLLKIHSNPELTYIDPDAMLNVPNLQQLQLHNNKLKMVYKDLFSGFNRIEVSLYGNPLQCDCNLRWLKQELNNLYYSNNTVNLTKTSIIFSDLSHLICDSPEKFSQKLVKDIDIRKIDKECPATAMYFSNNDCSKRLGDFHSLECRAIGIPPPDVYWILQDGHVVNQTSNHVRMMYKMSGTLTYFHLRESDTGNYTCVGENKLGRDFQKVSISVRKIDVTLIPTHVTATYVTLVWKGTERSTFPHYQMLYRQFDNLEGADRQFSRIGISSMQKSYTIANLKPDKLYEFCLTFDDGDGYYVQISCTQVRTKDINYAMQDLHKSNHVTAFVVMGVLSAVIFVICVIGFVAKRYKQRQLYEDPDKPLMSMSMSQIPMENLYSPLMSNVSS